MPRRSNWGRWGSDDIRGAVNLLTPARVLEALQLARTGETIELGSEVGKRGAITGGRNPTWHVTTQVVNPEDPGRGRAEDVLVMHTHAHSHLDGLAHVWCDGALYNGLPTSLVGRGGATRLAISAIGPLVGRGVLLDLTFGGERAWSAGECITDVELDQARQRQGVEVRSGDCLVLRTGWFDRFLAGDRTFYSGEPGLGAEAVHWLADADPAVIGIDNFGFEPSPTASGTNPLYVHEVLLHGCGIALMELLNLKRLAERGAGEFLFFASPLQIDKGLGSPINPVAVL